MLKHLKRIVVPVCAMLGCGRKKKINRDRKEDKKEGIGRRGGEEFALDNQV